LVATSIKPLAETDAVEEMRSLQSTSANRCPIGPVLSLLEPSQRQAILDAHGEGIEYTAIVKWVKKTTGRSLAVKSLSKHLRGECKCL
jgi:hypothetical protein